MKQASKGSLNLLKDLCDVTSHKNVETFFHNAGHPIEERESLKAFLVITVICDVIVIFAATFKFHGR